MYEDWDQVAKALGYENEEELLKGLYLEEQWSISQIAKRLGYGTFTINRRLERLGIQRRTRGGANARAKVKNTLHRLDQRYVFGAPIRAVAAVVRCHPSSVWHYIRGVTGGKFDAFRDHFADGSITPVFDPELGSFGLAADARPGILDFLQGKEGERRSSDPGQRGVRESKPEHDNRKNDGDLPGTEPPGPRAA